MAMATWYETCVVDGRGKQVDNSAHGTLDAAKSGIGRFRALYPGVGGADGGMIFVRQHMRGTKSRYRVLHGLTVQPTKEPR